MSRFKRGLVRSKNLQLSLRVVNLLLVQLSSTIASTFDRYFPGSRMTNFSCSIWPFVDFSFSSTNGKNESKTNSNPDGTKLESYEPVSRYNECPLPAIFHIWLQPLWQLAKSLFFYQTRYFVYILYIAISTCRTVLYVSLSFIILTAVK